jgi:dTDP-4-amino-4,6-dideoxygalactose transaminase
MSSGRTSPQQRRQPQLTVLRRLIEPPAVRDGTLLPVLRPMLPRVEEMLPYLRRIDERQWYSNYGPLVQELEQRIGGHYNAAPGGAVTVCNGTAGLTAALLAESPQRGSLCLMPSWTFSATPHAALAAGLTPYFLDVDPATWTPDVRLARQAAARLKDRIGAAVVVSPFGAPVDHAAWEKFSRDTGIPVVIDAAAGFDTAPVCSLPAMVSLHATKIVGAGEGGFVLTRDSDLRKRVQSAANYGFQGARCSWGVALNAKMSEYHAAVALTSIEQWPQTRPRHAAIMRWYVDGIAEISGVALPPGYGGAWVTGTTSIVLPEGSLPRVCRAFTEQGIETRQWWEQGCHAQPAFASCPRDPLPVTESLGRRVLGLPHFPGMCPEETAYVIETLGRSLRGTPRPTRWRS